MHRVITRAQLDTVIGELDDDFAVSPTVSDSYSGRGMYGKTCIAVTGDNISDAMKFVLVLVEVLYPHTDAYDQRQFILDLCQNMCTDNMGMSYVYYFPALTVED